NDLVRLDDDAIAFAQLARGNPLLASVLQPPRDCLGLGSAQRVRLRLAAPLGHGLGEIREEHRGPKPQRDLHLEQETLRAEEKDRGQHRAGFDEEHDRVLHHPARTELGERVEQRAFEDGAVEQGEFLLRRHQNTFPACIRKCSTYGPSESTGKYVSAPTMRITPMRRNVNSGPSTGNVPADSASFFFAASEPAMPISGMIIRKRPKNIAMPRARL